MFSLRNVREAAVAYQQDGDATTPTIMPKAEAEEIELIFNLLEAGVIDHTAILKE